jgi:phenylacetate-CoA ligase
LTSVAAYYRNEAIHDAAHPATAPKKTAVICANEWVHVSRLVFPTVTDPQREIRVFAVSSPVEQIAKQIEEYQPDRINGYASVIVELANMALEGRLKISPKMVSTYAEPLEDAGREAVKKAWGVSINNAYGSTEVGLVGYEGFDFDGMTISEDNVIIEFVNKNNEPVGNPNTADKCLMTKLYGKTMPLFRYEITDKLVLCDNWNDETSPRMRIKRIDGRTDVWFTYGDHNDVRVHPIVFRHILGQIEAIIEYQVQQTTHGAHILIITKGGGEQDTVDTLELTRQLALDLTTAGLENAHVSVEVVKDLPRHPESNKLCRFVPL